MQPTLTRRNAALVTALAGILPGLLTSPAVAACETVLDAARSAGTQDVATMAEAAACLNREIAATARSGAGFGTASPQSDEPMLGGDPGTTTLFSMQGAMLTQPRMDAFGSWLRERGYYNGDSLWAEYQAYAESNPMPLPDPDGPLLRAQTAGGPQVFIPVDPLVLQARPDLRALLRRNRPQTIQPQAPAQRPEIQFQLQQLQPLQPR